MRANTVRCLGLCCAAMWMVLATPALARPVSDFEDGTLQGWTKHSSYTGDLYVDPVGGNPGGFLVSTDTGDGHNWIVGPAEFSGDLSIYSEIQFDEYIFNRGLNNSKPVWPYLFSNSDDTVYKHGSTTWIEEEWRTRNIPWDSAEWVLWQGSAPMGDVLTDCTLGFFMDTSSSVGSRECGLDNITLVPEPGMLSLVAVCAMVMVRRRGR